MTDVHFTNQERKILFSLSTGNLYKEIAVEHEISVNTVKKHIKNIYRKMDVHKRGLVTEIYLSAAANQWSWSKETAL